MPLGRPSSKHNPFKSVDVCNRVSFVIGALTSHVINVAMQLKDANAVNISERAGIRAFISDDANGDSFTASAPTTTAIGTNGVAAATVTGKYFELVSESNGTIDLNITYNGAATWYLIIVMPDGTLVPSGPLVFV